MKKVIKIIGLVLLGLAVLAGLGLYFLSQRPYVPKGYSAGLNTGGEIEAFYAQPGPYEVSHLKLNVLEDFENYQLWYPADIASAGQPYPVVIFANGTGSKVSKYPALLEHLASWGFIAVGTDEVNSWNGFSCEMCLRLILKLNGLADYAVPGLDSNVFYGKADLENIGVSGHSQGGVGAITAVTDTKHADMYKTLFAASPTNKGLAHDLEWDYDAALVRIPAFLLSSTGNGDENLVVSLPQLREIYSDLNADTKIMARRNDADHGDMLYFADGYMTAWFMWQLRGDMEAAKAFAGEDAEILNNAYYRDVEKTF